MEQHLHLQEHHLTGTNNIYVVHKQGVIGNGLLPTSGRDSDRVGSLTVTGASTLTGNVTTSGNITAGSITAGGALSGVTTLTTTRLQRLVEILR